ncbi:MAG TPA: SUKH-3 domain-containing protein [Abditibacterium sp.]|jgi:hypothetical protein
MSPELEEKLRYYSWTPGRRVDDSQLHQWLKAAVQTYGCHVFPEAVRILREFGGLDFIPIRIEPINPHNLFDDPKLWLTLEWKFNKVLFPVAFYWGYYEILMVSTEGMIYSDGMVSGPYDCGRSFEEALENILFRRKAIELIDIIENRTTGEVFDEAEAIYKAIKSPS